MFRNLGNSPRLEQNFKKNTVLFQKGVVPTNMREKLDIENDVVPPPLKMFFLRYFCVEKLKYLMVDHETYQKVSMYGKIKLVWSFKMYFIQQKSNFPFFFTKSLYLEMLIFLLKKLQIEIRYNSSVHNI